MPKCDFKLICGRGHGVEHEPRVALECVIGREALGGEAIDVRVVGPEAHKLSIGDLDQVPVVAAPDKLDALVGRERILIGAGFKLQFIYFRTLSATSFAYPAMSSQLSA